jgi:hypothetical protein
MAIMVCLGHRGTGPTIGVVVDSGNGVMHYFAIPNFTRPFGVAGRIVTRYLIKLLIAHPWIHFQW